ncbi:MAG TPA: pilus assembly PilX N-terminal domain-containing protein [Candidatus Acidoferrales bacterium]|nr:pilus assembly PilX N-terminal domain-containing protein [Candidatus Acidoferrales bacterium]
MKNQTRNRERGVALFFSIFALLLLTAIGAALIFMASTETSVNSNYRQEQMAYFAAKAGLEEARARMMPSDPNSMFLSPGNATHPLFDPSLIAAPTTGNSMIYYVTNPGSGVAIQPWVSTDKYYDDELCHEGYTGFGGTTPPEERCPSGSLPAGAWHQSYASALPFSGTANALPYKWARVAPKLNGSTSYLSGTGATPTTATYSVNPNAKATVGGVTAAISGSTLICWDGSEEVPLTVSATPAISNCSQMTISAGISAGAKMTNVYVVTALGVSPTGARKMVQADVALQPVTPFPYGLFATSTSCTAINFNGNNASTNSYTTNRSGAIVEANPPSGGDIGSNGGVVIGNGNVGGIVGVLQPPPGGNGTCATPISINSPNGTMLGTTACPTGDNSNPPTSCYIQQPYVFPTPPIPSPIPPNIGYTPPPCPPTGKGKKSAGQCMSPGTWGNVGPINGTLTLAPGVYNINSFSEQGIGQIVVNPPGSVTFNIGGCGDATCSPANQLANPFNLAGNGIVDDNFANDFTINYGGSGTISITGGGTSTAILNAPNAALTQKGNGQWNGAILAYTVSLGGNAFFNYDKQVALAPVNNGYYTMIGYHEVPY